MNDNKINETIEIVEDELALSLLERSGNKNNKICLPLELCIGKFNLNDFTKRDEIKEYLKFLNKDEKIKTDFSEEFKTIQSMSENQKIRIWSSHFDCDDYCLLLFVCYNFSDKNISVVYSDEYNEYALNCHQLDVSEISKLELLEHDLSNEEILNYSKEWEQVLRDNMELRFLENQKVVSVDIDYFNKLIIERLQQIGEIYISKFIGMLYVNQLIPKVDFSDYIYFYLINRLIEKNMINKDEKDDKIYISCK